MIYFAKDYVGEGNVVSTYFELLPFEQQQFPRKLKSLETQKF